MFVSFLILGVRYLFGWFSVYWVWDQLHAASLFQMQGLLDRGASQPSQLCQQRLLEGEEALSYKLWCFIWEINIVMWILYCEN